MKRTPEPVAYVMFYEKRVASFRSLMREARVMDSDAGIRVVGRYGKERCYCFVTRFGGRYTVMIYKRSAGAKVSPGRLITSKEVSRVADLSGLLRDITKGGMEAYVY